MIRRLGTNEYAILMSNFAGQWWAILDKLVKR